ncbi:MAG: hypothetical protein Q4D98_11020 [Planctomycetia bacterium]|nr:hypothetical protein [Planctomycetia bacterium]
MDVKYAIPDRFLFRFSLPCLFLKETAGWSDLPEKYRLAGLEGMEGKSSGKASPLEVRAAWSAEGLIFQFRATGKKRSPWCNPNRPDESDRVELWLDTRNVRNVHRATRYCHRFVCLPTGGGKDGDDAVILPLPINRAKQQTADLPNGSVRIVSKIYRDGYAMNVFFTAASLTGWDTADFRELGFAWMVSDHELGVRTLTAGEPFPYMEDPSLWYVLSLQD